MNKYLIVFRYDDGHISNTIREWDVISAKNIHNFESCFSYFDNITIINIIKLDK